MKDSDDAHYATFLGIGLDKRIGVGAILQLIVLAVFAAIVYWSDIREALNVNKNAIAAVVETQKSIKSTQEKVVETLVIIRELLARMDQKDLDMTRRLDRLEGGAK